MYDELVDAKLPAGPADDEAENVAGVLLKVAVELSTNVTLRLYTPIVKWVTELGPASTPLRGAG
jgi:hypothetical protein